MSTQVREGSAESELNDVRSRLSTAREYAAELRDLLKGALEVKYLTTEDANKIADYVDYIEDAIEDLGPIVRDAVSDVVVPSLTEVWCSMIRVGRDLDPRFNYNVYAVGCSDKPLDGSKPGYAATRGYVITDANGVGVGAVLYNMKPVLTSRFLELTVPRERAKYTVEALNELFSGTSGFFACRGFEPAPAPLISEVTGEERVVLYRCVDVLNRGNVSYILITPRGVHVFRRGSAGLIGRVDDFDSTLVNPEFFANLFEPS